MVVIKLLALALFIAVGVTHLNPANYTPFAPNGFTGIHQGAAIVFFAYIGFDAISTAAEETRDPQRNLPIGILGGLAICTVIYVVVGAVLTGMVPYTRAGASPIRWRSALELAGFTRRRLDRRARRGVSMAAVLLVFQYGQPRIFFSMARDGLLPQWAATRRSRARASRTRRRSSPASSSRWRRSIGDAAETYDLTNIGTLFAFALVCVGVLVLRVKEPDRPRPFRVPFVWPSRRSARRPACSSWSGCRDRRGSVSASGSSSASSLRRSTAIKHSRLNARVRLRRPPQPRPVAGTIGV